MLPARALAVIVLVLCARTASAQATRPAAPAEAPALGGGASVVLPAADLRALLDRAGPAADLAPVDFAFAQAAYSVTVGERSASILLDAEVTLLNERWVAVPLGVNAGLLAATADGQAAPVALVGRDLVLLLDGRTKRKAILRLTLERPLAVEAGTTRLDLPLVPGPVVALTAAIPGAGLDVRAPGAVALRTATEAQTTTVAAHFAGGQVATLTWRQRAAGAQQAAPRTSADAQTLLTVERGLLRMQTKLDVRVERAPVRELRLSLDPRAVLIGVTGPDVARVAEEARDGARSVLVTLASELEGQTTLEVTCERDVPDAGGDVTIEPVSLAGARRNHGLLAVRTAGGYEARPGKAAPPAERLGVSELPAALRPDASTRIAWRYAEAPAPVALVLERLKQLPPKVFASTLTRVAVDRGGVLRYRADVTYSILHAGVDTFRIALPEGVELTSATGQAVRDTQVVTEGKARTLVVGLKDVAQGSYRLAVEYERRLADNEAEAAVALLGHPDAAADAGSVGIEVRGGYEVAATVAGEGVERVDVRELGEELWSAARSPLLYGFRYDRPSPPARLVLRITRHEDLDVLVAMADVCEVSTTVTADGKTITKMMFVVRNNLKQFMTLKMPEGAQVWSAFVDDRPVTPSRSARGEVLIPLRKSERVDEDDENSYRSKREQRRAGEDHQRLRQLRDRVRKLTDDDGAPADLKPYDVEIVFVTPPAKIEERGQLRLALPQCDVPTGHLAWAVFLPRPLRVVDAAGNLAEVTAFSLPFRHFGEAEHARQLAAMRKATDARDVQQAQQLAKAMEDVAAAERARAKGVLPVRVEIPIAGEIHRFEKFLAVEEAPALTLTYARKLP